MQLYMTTSSIPWYENAAWTKTLRIARKRSQPIWLGSRPERAIAPGFFQNWFLKFRLLCFAKSGYVDILWNQCGRPEVLHQDQWSIQQEVDQWSGPLSRMNYFMTGNKNILLTFDDSKNKFSFGEPLSDIDAFCRIVYSHSPKYL